MINRGDNHGLIPGATGKCAVCLGCGGWDTKNGVPRVKQSFDTKDTWDECIWCSGKGNTISSPKGLTNDA